MEEYRSRYFYMKLGRKVVYQILQLYSGKYMMIVQKRDNYDGIKSTDGGRAYAIIEPKDFEKLTSRDKIKIFTVLYLDAMYEADDNSYVDRVAEVTDDCVRLLWKTTGVINEFARRKAA